MSELSEKVGRLHLAYTHRIMAALALSVDLAREAAKEETSPDTAEKLKALVSAAFDAAEAYDQHVAWTGRLGRDRQAGI